MLRGGGDVVEHVVHGRGDVVLAHLVEGEGPVGGVGGLEVGVAAGVEVAAGVAQPHVVALAGQNVA